ncbi:hypothetical protein N7540_012693 [Penicillium herquei]|nr:hypothetical protein N7540_012693 [Penicillium herquei]
MALGQKLPPEILDLILWHVPQSSLVTESRTIMRSRDHSLEITKLNHQIDFLFLEVEKLNAYFWAKLAKYDPNDAALQAPTQEENTNYLRQAKASLRRYASYWFKTPGAVELIKEKFEARKECTSVDRSRSRRTWMEVTMYT